MAWETFRAAGLGATLKVGALGSVFRLVMLCFSHDPVVAIAFGSAEAGACDMARRGRLTARSAESFIEIPARTKSAND
jgi:hypothetical protein